VRAVSHLCEFYPGICLTTEEKARKNLSQCKKTCQVKKNLSQSTVYILPKHPHITKPTQTHTLQYLHIYKHTHTHITKQYKTRNSKVLTFSPERHEDTGSEGIDGDKWSTSTPPDLPGEDSPVPSEQEFGWALDSDRTRRSSRSNGDRTRENQGLPTPI
jgi:hypothetical protein